MSIKKLLIVFGTRPEAIKMCPLVNALKKRPDTFRTLVCVTGQHRQMLDRVLNLFDVVPDYDLDIMHDGQDLYDITCRVLYGMRDVLKNCRPDMVFVHGDTSTSTAAALAAFYEQIPVAHVEAGLRTNNIYSPWPEEMNRQITSRIASMHFAPTALSRDNLLKENVCSDKIIVTGNTVIDALHQVLTKIENDAELRSRLDEVLLQSGYKPAGNKRLVLITGHRRENFGDGFVNICQAIKQLSENNKDTDFVYPMHLNPNVRRPINDIFGNIEHDNLFFIEPLDYLPFVYLMSKCDIVLTDSGGIQEEAPGLGKPVLVMRNTTERPEAVEAGTVKLVGTDKRLIVCEVERLLHDKDYYRQMSEAVNPYGDGKACERIIRSLAK